MAEKLEGQPLLARCDKCGRPFVAGLLRDDGGFAIGIGAVYEKGKPSGMRIRGRAQFGPSGASWEDIEVDCPRVACDGVGHVPSGFVAWFHSTIDLLRAMAPDELSALRAALSGKANESEIIAATPEDARPWLEQAFKRFQANYIVQILLMILAIIEGGDAVVRIIPPGVRRAEATIETVDDGVREAVGVIVHHHKTPRQPTQRATPPATERKPPAKLPNLNDPCWCGSGRKYRRCHRPDSPSRP